MSAAKYQFAHGQWVSHPAYDPQCYRLPPHKSLPSQEALVLWMGRQTLKKVADIWLLGPADNRPNPCGTQFPHPKGGRPFCDRLSPLIAIRKPRPPTICMRRSDKKAYHPSPDRVTMGKCAAFAGRGSASLTDRLRCPFVRSWREALRGCWN